jgi:hypothetical protein
MAFGPTMVQANLTVECIPTGGPVFTGGDVVEVKCFVTMDVARTFVAAQLDVSCSLAGQIGSAGTVQAIGMSVDTLHAPEPYFLAGVGGPWVIDNSLCAVALFPTFVIGQVTIPAGTKAYLATILYEVSDCAAGTFDLAVEDAGDPPVSVGTRFFGTGDQVFLYDVVPASVTIGTGTCCVGSTCVQDGINETCCVNSAPGARYGEGLTCGDDHPCPCENDGECGDLLFCNGIERCDNGIECLPGEPPCGDGDDQFLCDEQRNLCIDLSIPTVSSWGLIILAAGLAIGAKLRPWRG